MRIILASIALVALGGHTFAQAPSAVDLAGRIQARQATIRDFTADFIQTTTSSSTLLPRSEERGQIRIKKPGRLRWSYTTSNHDDFIADGQMFYQYFPKDRYVAKGPLPEGSLWSFLAGRGDLTRDFVPQLAANQPPGEWHLMLTSRTPQPTLKSLTLQVDRTSLQLRGVVVVDQQGTMTYRFDRLRENVGLPDSDFTLKIPKGVEVREGF